MKKAVTLILMLSLITLQSVGAETYDLNGYLDAVRNHSKDLKLAEKEKEMAKANKKEAISGALPKIGLNAGYTRNITDYYMYFDLSALMPGAHGTAKAPIKRDNEYSASVGLEQTLFSPTVGSAIKAAKQYQKLTDFIYEASEQAVVAGAKKLFYQCLLLEKVWEVSQSAQENALANFENMKLKHENGQISQLALLQAETRWRGTIPETEKAKRNWNLAINTLKNLAGFDLEKEIDLNGSFDDIPEIPAPIEMESILRKRPDFNALLWEEKLRQTSVTATKGTYFPTLTGTVAYAYSGQSNEFKFDEENNLLFAGVELTLPLYTGGMRRANVQKAQIELAKTRVNIDKTKENISNEMTNVYLRLQEAHQRIESAESMWNVAEQAFEIAETTTTDGLTTQLELKDARLMYDQARLNYYAAVLDYLTAYFDWEQATGRVRF